MIAKQKLPAPAECRGGENRQAAGECAAGRGWLLADATVYLQIGVRLDGCRGKAIVVPPVHDGGADGQAGGDEGVQLVIGDGQHLHPEAGEDLIGQCQGQAGGASDGAGGDVGVHSMLLSTFSKNAAVAFIQGYTGFRTSCRRRGTIPFCPRCR